MKQLVVEAASRGLCNSRSALWASWCGFNVSQGSTRCQALCRVLGVHQQTKSNLIQAYSLVGKTNTTTSPQLKVHSALKVHRRGFDLFQASGPRDVMRS